MRSIKTFGWRSLALLFTSAILNTAALHAAAGAIRLEPVLRGLSAPSYVTNAHDGSQRLFVVEQPGRIQVLASGSATPSLYLDIASKVLYDEEHGLLGLAYHPQFASNGRFFVDYTRQPDGATVIAEYHALADPATTAATENVLLVIPQPYAGHRSGMIEFGDDGYLYIGTADGGSGGDPENRAQNINELLGKILRIDVDRPAGGLNYSSPASNPFVGTTSGRAEIFALGLSNPFRFSFDRETGQLYVGDVGESLLEEVDIVGVGGNYGWRVYEGTNCTGLDASLCTPSNYRRPIVQYDHSGGRCSIIGGYVYRGVAATFAKGTYLFGDLCSGEIFSLGSGTPDLLMNSGLKISSFGRDEAGEIYVAGLGGTVDRIIASASTATTSKVTDVPKAGSTSTALSQIVSADAGGESNVALASAGAVASASSSLDAGYPVTAINNNERAGANWGNGGGWADGTPSVFPDWVQINFSGSKTIDRVVIYTVQDNFGNPVEPTDTMTFGAYGITDFNVQGWNGSAWLTLATISGNNLVKRTVTFAPFTTTQIRINSSNALGRYSTITEVEAWGTGDSGGGPAATTTALSSSANPASVGSSVTFTASVSGGNPTGSVAFTDGGNAIAGCSSLALSGSGNTRSTTCTTSGLAAGTHSIVATYAGDTGNAGSTSTALSQVVSAGSGGETNVALASAGAVASASSSLDAGYPVAAINNNERAGANWGNGGGWADGTPSVFPDWVQINFNGSKTIDRVVVYTVQDNFGNPVEPTDTMTFGAYGITDFNVQGWNGSAWVTLATVSGNNLVKRTVTFAPFTTTQIRINSNNALGHYSTITEVEAWGIGGSGGGGPAATTTALSSSANPASVGSSVTFTANVTGNNPTGSVRFSDGGSAIAACSAVALSAGSAACTTSSLAVGSHSIVASYSGDAGNAASTSTALAETINAASNESNVALASAGAVASASSSLDAGYPVTAINNNERAGANWGNGGGWADGTPSVFPDWVQINFNGSKTIDRVVVYTVQDNFNNPLEPTDTMTFGAYGITDFNVQGWNGSAWVTLATVSGNNLVKRSVTFTPFTTTQIRINSSNALGHYSTITEVEAWGTGGGGGGGPAATTTALSSSANPASVGSSVTFTASVSGGNPTGSVAFTDGGSAIAGCSSLALSGSGNIRSTTCTTSGLAVGTHSIVATYAGDTGNTGSASSALSQVINVGTLPSTTTVLTSSANPSTLGSSVTFTASVTGSNPAGSVAFTDGGSAIAGCSSLALSGSGNTRSTTCTTSGLAAGTHSIVAAYAGDAGNAGSSSAPQAQVIFSDGLTLTLSGTVYSGGAPLAGVRFDSSGGEFYCPNSDSSGHYFCSVSIGWSGTITPVLTGYEFTPSQRTYDRVVADETQDYIATQ